MVIPFNGEHLCAAFGARRASFLPESLIAGKAIRRRRGLDYTCTGDSLMAVTTGLDP
jgi:hypothetical protein